MRLVRSLFVCLPLAVIGLTISAAARATEPQALPNDSFTVASSASKFVSKAGAETKCTSDEASGVFTSDKAGTFDLLFLGCTALLKVSCLGLVDTIQGSILVKGSFQLVRLLNGAAGVALLPEQVHLTCGGTLVVVRGCMAGSITTAKSNTAEWAFKQIKGVAEFTDFTSGSETVGCILEWSIGGGKFEQIALETTENLTFDGGVEVEIMG